MKNFENLHKPTKKTVITLVICITVLVLLFFGTNPKYIPFLSDAAQAKWENALDNSALFGDFNQSTKISNFSLVMIPQLITMIAIVLSIVILLRIILHAIKPKNKRFATVKTLILSCLKYVAAIVGVLWGLNILGVSTGAIFASLGITALILGFGAESIIADMISGLLMVFESQYNVGDVIEVNGFLGTVTDIALRTTSITDFGGNIKIMNNSDVRNILNRSNEDSKAICDVGIAYEEDIEHVEEVLDKVLIATEKKYPAIFTEKPQYIGVQELGESSVTLRILAKVAEKDVFAARRILNREIKIGFEKENIFIPFPQLVVTEKK